MTLEIAYYTKLVCGNAVSTILDKGVGKEASLLKYPPPPPPPLPLINVGFSTKQNGDFSSNIEYGGGGPQEHALS